MLRSTAVLVLVLALFFLFKVLRFQTLAYTYHDMYVFLQLATGWLDSRPFMYDNYWGDHQRIHNYYTLWLWGPICYKLGAYGLFLVQTLLLLIAYGLTNQRLARENVPNWARYGLFAVVLLSPIAGWLNDHTSMGWHTELTYLPFGLFFALALTGRSMSWPILAGLSITLVKEDGAVLAAMIHLAYFGSTYLRQHPDRSLWKLLTERRFWFISLGWGAVFMAGMVWLAYLNNFAEPRLRDALALIAQNVDKGVFWLQIGQELGTTLLLILPASLFMYVLSQPLTKAVRVRLFRLYGLGIAILSAMNFVQSSLYYNPPPSFFHLLGLTWPPRFVLLWAFTAAFLMITILLMPQTIKPVLTLPTWLVVSGLVLIQLPILYLVRRDLPRLAELNALVHGRISPTKNNRYVDPADLIKIQCLAEQLPARSNVIAYSYVMPYFHKRYVVWPTGKQYQPADLALVPIDDQQVLPKELPMRQPYRVIRLKGYFLFVAADVDKTVQSCVR